MKILALCFDFRIWSESKAWSYASGYLACDELTQREGWQVDFHVFPYSYCEDKIDSVLKVISSGTKYDLVLIWLPHLRIARKTIDEIRTSGARVVFVLAESLLYSRQDIKELPHLRFRWAETTSLVRKKTDLVISLCPATADKLRGCGYRVKFTWGFYSRKVFDTYLFKGLQANDFFSEDECIFAATMYNDARRITSNEVAAVLAMQGMTVRTLSDDQELIASYNNLSQKLEAVDLAIAGDFLNKRLAVCKEILNVRRELWCRYVSQFKGAKFTISLPSYFKGAPGRVIESLIMGVPICLYKPSIPRCYWQQFLDTPIMTAQNQSEFSNVLMSRVPVADQFVSSFFDNLSELVAEEMEMPNVRKFWKLNSLWYRAKQTFLDDFQEK